VGPTRRPAEDGAFLSRAIDVSVRIAVVAVVVFWCLQILRPFVQPVIWGAIIAVATQPLYRRLESLLGGRSRLAATLLVVVALALLIGPTVALTASLVETAAELSGELRHGSLAVPPPPAFVADWPLVGHPLSEYWSLANQNLDALLRQIAPQLKAIGLWLVSSAATTGLGIVKFVISIVIAGVMLANGRRAAATTGRIAGRLAGERGARLTLLAGATVQSVTRGILGVAAIQALMAGAGYLAVGVPAAGLWALLTLLVAVLQLPTLVVLAPIVVYVFSTSSTPVAVAFAIWSLAVGLIDNVLKPLLMGRGVDVPMLVIFMGAIGGFMLEGIIGLFTGAVVLAVGYSLLTAWLEPAEAGGGTATSPAGPPP
jgi:predicted PurR-regulated permease PerM